MALRELLRRTSPRGGGTRRRRMRAGLALTAVVAVAGATALAVTDERGVLLHPGPGSAVSVNASSGDRGELEPERHPLPKIVPKQVSNAPSPTAAPTVAPTTQAVRRAATVTAGRPHVLVIMEENKGYGATLGACAADPYLCSLAATYASDTSWFGIGHPSAPNYVALVSGGTQGVASDCTPPGCGPFAVTSLGGQLTAAGIPWRAYMESMPSPCATSGSSGAYAEKHNPFLYFDDVRSAADCATVEQPYPGVAGLLAALDGPAAPDFVWITPNLNDDMHDGSVAQGDAWLSANLAPVLASPWFAANGTAIVTMDENDAQASPGGGQVPMVVISGHAHGAGAVATHGNHYGTLRSIEEVYGLGLLGAAASSASGDLVSLFGGPW